ncbi:hypothetical protein NDU88_002871 [Pleurodeles waltl]|uniref:Uncharacterized protein n=1 Tax=Pleurodeles waltl TaxID=8319 RepID=A0AAV7W5A0_PLEWA|nr:hypothetical protein NDU88_002871 [Pleurodeles waltl]
MSASPRCWATRSDRGRGKAVARETGWVSWRGIHKREDGTDSRGEEQEWRARGEEQEWRARGEEKEWRARGEEQEWRARGEEQEYGSLGRAGCRGGTDEQPPRAGKCAEAESGVATTKNLLTQALGDQQGTEQPNSAKDG